MFKEKKTQKHTKPIAVMQLWQKKNRQESLELALCVNIINKDVIQQRCCATILQESEELTKLFTPLNLAETSVQAILMQYTPRL